MISAYRYHKFAPVHWTAEDDSPPTFTELRDWEMKLPQHNLSLPFPEGRLGRYVLFSNSREHHVGWNNKLNDMLMNTWLAYSSNRGYVFHDFIWTPSHYPWPVSARRSRELLPRTPLNALISGPSAGGSWEDGDKAPRSISEAWFDIVCPKSERRIINTRDVKSEVNWADGKVIFEKWRKLLTDAPERCVEVVAGPPEEEPFPETFDIWFWSGERSISLWDEFKDSPVSRLLSTSPIIQSAIDENWRYFVSKDQLNKPFDNVLSIHVRRGDFKEACLEHAAENSTFYNWNLLSFLPDKFHPPTAPAGVVLPKGKNTPENEAIFLARCLPSAASITSKVRAAREAYLQAAQSTPGLASSNFNRLKTSSRKSLDVLYIMSNDRTKWLDDLKESLRQDGWDRIVTSKDLKLTAEQKEVGVAVDMDIGRRSAVFIGNGWSSFTSNVVHRRLVDGKEPISIRFW
ncbi:Strobilurin A biosynthesis cluster protein l1 [Psilocybe cubensis]|uniref:Uncharacterized protein n=2 Tax=Psilocybe cubensis TaxID=181762 RepID=A0A8H7XKI3_PSICU|nr:Strobilurin A biosynthesis cluster protein l1 [Psilocybe cubensis]KAH9480264.1 Strobilurin A biosynthesis cluster protein l1 [Psilocybe cubensis]